MEDTGKFEARYLAFLETIGNIRPRLHRYCARMTGSITDAEDLVQDTLFRAYRSLDTYHESRPLVPWLFRIAHNQCIDFLRRRGVRETAEAVALEPDFVEPGEPPGPAICRAIVSQDEMLHRGCGGGPGGGGRFDEIRFQRHSLGRFPYSSTPKKVDALVVCDAKQPRDKRAALVVSVEATISAKKG